jgi:hypothetical protein
MEYIYEIPNLIDDAVCDDIINKFESDTRKRPGAIGSGTIDETIKKSTDLYISNLKNWSHVDGYLYNRIGEGLKYYMKHLEEELSVAWDTIWARTIFENISDTGYQIQRVDKNGFYKWHYDSNVNVNENRHIAVIFYLNTLNCSEGGSTDFMLCNNRVSIRPEKGKVIFFPVAWPFLHSGTPVLSSTKSKYIITTFLKG